MRLTTSTFGRAVLASALAVLSFSGTAGARPSTADSAADRPDDGTFGYVATMPVAPQGIDWLSGFPDGTAYVKHSDGGVALLARSTDFGQTWTKLADPPFGGNAITKFATPKRGYNVGNGLVHTSSDGATSWQPAARVPVTKGGVAALTALGVATGRATGAIYVGGQDYGPFQLGPNEPTGTYVWRSGNGGKGWTRTLLPGNGFVDDIRAYDDKIAAARVYDIVNGVGNRTAIWVTTDAGRQWRRAFDCPSICTSLGFAGPGRLFAGTHDGRLFATTDGGRRWALNTVLAPLSRPELVPTKTHSVYGISFSPDGRTAVVGTNGRGTYRSTDGGRTWTSESPSPQDVYGFGIGDAVLLDRTHALVGGPHALAVRMRLDDTAPRTPAAVPTTAATTLTSRGMVRYADGRITRR